LSGHSTPPCEYKVVPAGRGSPAATRTVYHLLAREAKLLYLPGRQVGLTKDGGWPIIEHA
jgi:hypothetical protein